MKWDYSLLRPRMSTIHIVSHMFSLNMHRQNHLNIKKGKTVPSAFIEIVNESNRKPSKLWVDPGR